MKAKYRISALLMALGLFLISVFAAVPLSRWLIERQLRPGLIQALGLIQSDVTYKSPLQLNKGFAAEGTLPVFGSSELSSASAFHPVPLFQNRANGFLPFLIGQGGSQDLIHALGLASLEGSHVQGKKLVVILSAQWFAPEGLRDGYFNMNFSAVQAYEMLDNPALPRELKARFARRLLDFSFIGENYPALQMKLGNLVNPEQERPWLTVAYYPQSQLDLAALRLKDTLKTALLIYNSEKAGVKPRFPRTNPNLKPWEDLREEAVKEGKPLITNNPFWVQDHYFDTYIKSELANLKDAKRGAAFYPSPEYGDLQLLMDVIKAQGGEALFVIVPVNGYWYDYIGFPQEERRKYYSRVKEQIEKAGFQTADFADHEYEPYFFSDIMHLGWKGWVYINESMDLFYHRRN